MLYVEPDFYRDFQCTAGDCRHSCCLGWEIDIDDDTAELYSMLPGSMGEELRREVCLEPAPHFRLTGDERCPFLNEKGLCRLILEYGEDLLCDICREHPRFYKQFPGRQEAGLGLCCEEAARLLLAGTEPLKLVYSSEPEPEGPGQPEPEPLFLRGRVLDILAEREQPMDRRIELCLKMLGLDWPGFDMERVRAFYLGLERLDESWTKMLEGTWGAACPLPSDVKHTRLLQYFVYRHMAAAEDKEQAGACLCFCILSLSIIWAMEQGGGELMELARLYSAEIEYSDENTDLITGAINSLLLQGQHI